MPSILNAVKPLLDRGTALLSNVPGPAGAVAKRLGSDPAPQAGAATGDQTLQFKVESALYRLPGVARSRVHVTVADAAVTVHGAARDEAQAARIEAALRGVPGVEGYASRLEVPKAPAKATPKAGRRKAGKKKPAAGAKAKAKDAS
jgi:copper chaperone CopZ